MFRIVAAKNYLLMIIWLFVDDGCALDKILVKNQINLNVLTLHLGPLQKYIFSWYLISDMINAKFNKG